jgi:hypothetical protein
MTHPEVYRDLKGREFALGALDAEERSLIEDFRARVAALPQWHEFEGYWPMAVARLYDSRGLSRTESIQTAVFQIAQDLSSRLAVATGLARLPDYRDQLAAIARDRFKTRREFCEATGLSEDMLSHVLARRKHLSMESLMQALGRIGYVLQIIPNPVTGNETAGKPDEKTTTAVA